jgi:hypothetical protein
MTVVRAFPNASQQRSPKYPLHRSSLPATRGRFPTPESHCGSFRSSRIPARAGQTLDRSNAPSWRFDSFIPLTRAYSRHFFWLNADASGYLSAGKISIIPLTQKRLKCRNNWQQTLTSFL